MSSQSNENISGKYPFPGYIRYVNFLTDEFEQRSQFGRAADTTFQAASVEAKGQSRSAVRLARPAALNEWWLLPFHADKISSAHLFDLARKFTAPDAAHAH